MLDLLQHRHRPRPRGAHHVHQHHEPGGGRLLLAPRRDDVRSARDHVEPDVGGDTSRPRRRSARRRFTFASSEPGSTFECSIDGGAFTPCTSPFTPPALARASTRSRARDDAAGNADATPATRVRRRRRRRRTHRRHRPDPTPTPTPEPTPQFNQTVVVEPVSGTVQVCPKGGKCCTLAAGADDPVGSTVDTKKGAVELTSVPSAPARRRRRRVFSDGIFKVTQRGGDHRPHAHRAARALPEGRRERAAKKPKSRKLWGKGKGKFRTVGQATARRPSAARSGSCRTPAPARSRGSPRAS